jgi:hypothetical protein
LDTSSVETRSRPARLLRIVGRPALLVSALTAAMLVIAVSCGGGDNDSNSSGDGEERTYTIQTFTPTVPGTTPDTLVTRDARQTAAANTATAVAENPPQPTATVTPGGPDPEDAFRPPFTQLSDGANQMEGVAGSYALPDEESQTYPVIQAPFYDVGENGLTVPAAGQLEFSFTEEVAPPSEVQVAIYDWAENNAIPQSTDGNVGSYPVFAKRVAPVIDETFPNANPSFAMPDEPGRYVVMVEVRWPPDDRVNPQLPSPHATYAFTVYVS